jgi:hypothetical protein
MSAYSNSECLSLDAYWSGQGYYQPTPEDWREWEDYLDSLPNRGQPAPSSPWWSRLLKFIDADRQPAACC